MNKQPMQMGPQQATPEQQALYNRFVAMATLHAYDDKVMKGIIEDAKQDPVQAIGRATANVGYVTMQKAEQDGEMIPQEVLLQGGKEITAVIAEMVQASGVADLSPEQVEQAFYVAADTFRMMMQESGEIDPEQVARGVDEMSAMQETGELDAMMAAIEQSQGEAR